MGKMEEKRGSKRFDDGNDSSNGSENKRIVAIEAKVRADNWSLLVVRKWWERGLNERSSSWSMWEGRETETITCFSSWQSFLLPFHLLFFISPSLFYLFIFPSMMLLEIALRSRLSWVWERETKHNWPSRTTLRVFSPFSNLTSCYRHHRHLFPSSSSSLLSVSRPSHSLHG